MKNIKVIAVLLSIALLAPSCVYVKNGPKAIKASGSYKTVDFDDLSEFSSIECNGAFDIEYSVGPYSVSADIPDNILEYFEADVKDGCLVLGYGNRKIYNMDNMKVRISSPSLSSITANGAIDFESRGKIVCGSFSCKCNGAADMEFENVQAGNISLNLNGAADMCFKNIDAERTTVEISGAGDVSLSGRSDSVSYIIQGAGDVNLDGLQYDKLEAAVNGRRRK